MTAATARTLSRFILSITGSPARGYVATATREGASDWTAGAAGPTPGEALYQLRRMLELQHSPWSEVEPEPLPPPPPPAPVKAKAKARAKQR